MSGSYCIGLAALDDFDMAVARFDRNGVLTYQNPAAAHLFGVAMDEHVEIGMLFNDPVERQRIMDQLRTRFEGKSSVYRTVFHPPHRAENEAGIPVAVFAFPDSDVEGRVIGSITLLRDLSEECTRERIHAAIESNTDNDSMLAELAAHLRTMLGFDELRVVTISETRAHLRRLYSSDEHAEKKFPFRWWPMPLFVRETLPEKKPEVIEVDALLADPNYQRLLEQDKVSKEYFQSGVRQILSLPVYEENRVVAFFSLDSHKDGVYTEETVRLVERLPVAEAVLAGIHREQREQRKQVYELIKDLGAETLHAQEAAKVLVDRLVETFGWDHVSIFQNDGLDRPFRLIHQATTPGMPALPDLYQIPVGPGQDAQPWGAIAEATAGGVPVNITDTRARGPVATVVGSPLPGSQLAIPITGRKMNWVLNIESRFTNAFASEEVDLLKWLADEACSVLHRAALFELQEAVLRSINDAVIETDADGRIRWSNRAARIMFQLDTEKSERTLVTDLIDNSAKHALLTQTPEFDHEEVTMRGADGTPIPVLLSAATLPAHLSGRVYVATDFRFQKEVQRLTELKEVFRQAALEGRVPLALASIWLSEFAQLAPAFKESVEKVAAQLGRADLPLERLLRLFSAETDSIGEPRADLNLALQTTIAELPESLAQALALSNSPEHMLVGVSFNNLQFCVESMISFGLRTRPQSKMLTVRSERQHDLAHFSVTGEWQPDMASAAGPGPNEPWRRKVLSDLTLGSSVIERIVRKGKGEYRCDLEAALCLEFTLPLVAD